VKVFTCSNILLSITILLLIGSVPLKAMILVFWCEIFIPNACTVWCKDENTKNYICTHLFIFVWVWNLGLPHHGKNTNRRCLSRVLGTRRNKVTRGWRKLNNEEKVSFWGYTLNFLHANLRTVVIWMIKPRRITWVGHTSCMGQMRNANKNRKIIVHKILYSAFWNLSEKQYSCHIK
jgi:hypothetical protein